MLCFHTVNFLQFLSTFFQHSQTRSFKYLQMYALFFLNCTPIKRAYFVSYTSIKSARKHEEFKSNNSYYLAWDNNIFHINNIVRWQYVISHENTLSIRIINQSWLGDVKIQKTHQQIYVCSKELFLKKENHKYRIIIQLSFALNSVILTTLHFALVFFL